VSERGALAVHESASGAGPSVCGRRHEPAAPHDAASKAQFTTSRVRLFHPDRSHDRHGECLPALNYRIPGASNAPPPRPTAVPPCGQPEPAENDRQRGYSDHYGDTDHQERGAHHRGRQSASYVRFHLLPPDCSVACKPSTLIMSTRSSGFNCQKRGFRVRTSRISCAKCLV